MEFLHFPCHIKSKLSNHSSYFFTAVYVRFTTIVIDDVIPSSLCITFLLESLVCIIEGLKGTGTVHKWRTLEVLLTDTASSGTVTVRHSIVINM
jgi:hypothetical protein